MIASNAVTTGTRAPAGAVLARPGSMNAAEVHARYTRSSGSAATSLVDVRDCAHQHRRCTGQRVGLDNGGVETLYAHRRAVPLGAIPSDQARNGRTSS